MNQNPNGTDALFEIIRKELNIIIENGEKKLQASKEREQSRTRKDDNKGSKYSTNSRREFSLSPRATAAHGQGIFNSSLSREKPRARMDGGEVLESEQSPKQKNTANPRSQETENILLGKEQSHTHIDEEEVLETKPSSKREYTGSLKTTARSQGAVNKSQSRARIDGVQAIKSQRSSKRGYSVSPRVTTRSSQNKEKPKARVDSGRSLKTQPSSRRGCSASPRTTTPCKGILKKAAVSAKVDEENLVGQASSSRLLAGLSTDQISGTERTTLPKMVRIQEKDSKFIDLKTKFRSTLENDIASQTAFLDSPRSKSIDADIQRMQMELQESYKLFQGISEKFETINFHNLQKRIKELNLAKKREMIGSQRSDEIQEIVEEGFKTNRMNEMTTKVGEKFKKHPGEFGNIPELSSFFQACTQLEHVLGSLKRQRTDVRDLEDRMRKSAEISYNRVSRIKKQLEEQEFEKPIRMQDSLHDA